MTTALWNYKIFGTKPSPALLQWIFAGIAVAMGKHGGEATHAAFCKVPEGDSPNEAALEVYECWGDEFELCDYNYELVISILGTLGGE